MCKRAMMDVSMVDGAIMLDYEIPSFISLLLKTYHNKPLSQKRVVKLKKHKQRKRLRGSCQNSIMNISLY